MFLVILAAEIARKFDVNFYIRVLYVVLLQFFPTKIDGKSLYEKF